MTATTTWPVLAPDGRPAVDPAIGDLRAFTETVWKAIAYAQAADPRGTRLFRYGSKPARVGWDGRTRVIEPLVTAASLRHELANLVYFGAPTKGGTLEAQAPRLDLIENVLWTPAPPLPLLTRLVAFPVFAPTGDLLLRPGFDAASGIYYAPGEGLEGLGPGDVPVVPTRGDVAWAVYQWVGKLLAEFPFASPADLAVALAFALLPHLRDLIDGPSPMTVFDAPQPGTGKSLLARTLLAPVLGHDLRPLTDLTEPAEWRKQITTALQTGTTAVLFDNITGAVTSSALAKALTDLVWTDRALGTNKQITVPVRCCWGLTSNNASFNGDLTRRTVPCRLDAGTEHPEDRSGFALDLEEEPYARRAVYVRASLVLIRHWLARGATLFAGRRLGSYERYVAVLGGVLEAAGVPGFLENLADHRERADEEHQHWAAFVADWWAWREKQAGRQGPAGVSARELHREVYAVGDGYPPIGRDDGEPALALGYLLRGKRDAVFGGKRVVSIGRLGNANRWDLCPV